MSFYSSWFKNTVSNSNGPLANAIALQADLTPAQVTVSTTGNRLVYNMEYKPIKEDKPKPKNLENRSRESSISSTSSNTFVAANIVAARFQNRSRSHTGGHSRQESTESQALIISEDSINENSMWEDWIVKYVNKNKQTPIINDALMEDWIFETL